MNKRFTPTKKAFLYFYSKIEGKYKFLFIHNFLEPKKFGTISTDVTLKDNHPLFALGRTLTNSFYKLFLNLDNLINGKIKDISKLFLPNNRILSHYELWSDNVMNYWLDKLSEKIIQYDEIPETKIYFIEIPLLELQKLNDILKKINYKFSFIYVSKDEDIEKIELDTETSNIIKELNLSKISSHIKSTEEFYQNNEGDLYIILACKMSGKEEKGFFHFPSLFKGIYRRNKEDWRYLLVSKDEYPDEEMLNKTKCLIIPGSELSVHDNIPFLRKTEKYMSKLIEDIEKHGKYPNLKILGICFGLEIIMSGLGGKLNMGEWNKDSRFGPEIIHLKDEFWNLNYVKNSGVAKKSSLIIAEAHSEQIIKYPPKQNNFFLTMGSSDVCECEVSVDKKGQVLMFQGHPEYSPGLSISRSLPMIMEFSGFKEKDINIKTMEKFEKNYMNLENNKNSSFNEWRAICDSFMRY